MLLRRFIEHINAQNWTAVVLAAPYLIEQNAFGERAIAAIDEELDAVKWNALDLLKQVQQERHLMKKLQCDRCDFVAEGETFEDWMRALQPHYMAAHTDVMNDPANGKQEMDKWMAENRARFEAA